MFGYPNNHPLAAPPHGPARLGPAPLGPTKFHVRPSYTTGRDVSLGMAQRSIICAAPAWYLIRALRIVSDRGLANYPHLSIYPALSQIFKFDKETIEILRYSHIQTFTFSYTETHSNLIFTETHSNPYSQKHIHNQTFRNLKRTTFIYLSWFMSCLIKNICR